MNMKKEELEIVEGGKQDEEPLDITGSGGVIFDAGGAQIPSNGGQPLPSGPPLMSEDTMAVVMDAMTIASTVASINKQFHINPAVGIQIVGMAMQDSINRAHLAQLAVNRGERPDGNTE